jgi:hypothetical protein
MMMESMIKLPDDIFRQELLPYLIVQDIVNLDNACMNHKYRPQLMEKISGVILLGDEDISIKASLFKWLGMRRIYLIKMKFVVSDFSLTPSSTDNDYVDQFRYTQHVFMTGAIRANMAFDISRDITDHTLQSIADHCTGLQSLSLICCRYITDTVFINISMRCHELKSLTVMGCRKITDASIISISTHCSGLQSLNLGDCRQITDASIISISTHCSGLQSLNVHGCYQITDASIISISTHCTGLLSLHLEYCNQITDASIISISENCTGLKELNVFFTAISDASLITIAKNCTGLHLLRTYGCNGISSDDLRSEFNSVSELRAILLSIYPSLPI